MAWSWSSGWMVVRRSSRQHESEMEGPERKESGGTAAVYGVCIFRTGFYQIRSRAWVPLTGSRRYTRRRTRNPNDHHRYRTRPGRRSVRLRERSRPPRAPCRSPGWYRDARGERHPGALSSNKGIGSRLRATKTEIESQGVRFEHAVVRMPEPKGRGSTWRAGPRLDHALHVLRRTRRRVEQPFDRPREPWPETGWTGRVLVLRALLHAYEVFAVPDGIDGARYLVNDRRAPLAENKQHRTLGEVFIGRIEPGYTGNEIPIPAGYEQHGEWVRGHEDYGSLRTIASNWADRRYHLAVCFAEAAWAERRLVLRDPVEQTIQATIDGYREEDGLWRPVEGSKVYRYVNWMGSLDKRYAPPADLRLRVQCEAVVERPGKASKIVRFESYRGEEWARVREACLRDGLALGGGDRLVEVRHAKDQRNPHERSAARMLSAGAKRRARPSGRT